MQDFIFLVLLCGWLSNVKFENPGAWTVVDLFCGEARISKLAAKLGFRTASIDVRMPGSEVGAHSRKRKRTFTGPNRNLMDFNGHCGLPYLSRNRYNISFTRFVMFVYVSFGYGWGMLNDNKLYIYVGVLPNKPVHSPLRPGWSWSSFCKAPLARCLFCVASSVPHGWRSIPERRKEPF